MIWWMRKHLAHSMCLINLSSPPHFDSLLYFQCLAHNEYTMNITFLLKLQIIEGEGDGDRRGNENILEKRKREGGK